VRSGANKPVVAAPILEGLGASGDYRRRYGVSCGRSILEGLGASGDYR